MGWFLARIGPVATTLVLGFATAHDASAATLALSGSELRYTAAAGEVNDLRFRRAGDTYVVSDPGAAVTASQPCIAAETNTAVCPQSAVSSLHVALGDGDDTALIDIQQIDAPWLPATVDGGDGDDRLTGGWGDDVLEGGAGDDTLAGDNGEDVLRGGPGADVFAGGLVNDRVDYSDHQLGVTVTLDGIANDGEVGEGDNVGGDVEVLVGGAGPDVLNDAGQQHGGPGDDRLSGGFWLYGDDGDDVLTAGAQPSRLEGGAGDDVLIGSAERDDLCGDVFNDFFWRNLYPICQGDGNDRIDGRGGDDLMAGGGGTDAFTGGDGRDTVTYADGDHTGGVRVSLDGVADDGAPGEAENVAGIEVLQGSGGDDVLVGGSGPETLIGDFGDDRIDGAGGDDFFQAGPGDDTFAGGPGADTIDYSIRTATCTCNYDTVDGVEVTLDDEPGDGAAGERDDVRSDVENVVGSLGPDRLVGSASPNRLSGGDGADSINGGGGDDVLRGGHGNDAITSLDDARDDVDCDAHDGPFFANSGPGTGDKALSDDLDQIAACEDVDVRASVRKSGAPTPDDAQPAPTEQPAPARDPLPTRAPTSVEASRLPRPVAAARLHVLSARLRRQVVTARVRCMSTTACRSLVTVVARRGGVLGRNRLVLAPGATRTIRIRISRTRRLGRAAKVVATTAGGVTTARALKR